MTLELAVALLALLVAAALVLPPPMRPLPADGRTGRAGAVTATPSGEGGATVQDAASAIGLLAATLRCGAGPVECFEAVAEVDSTPAGRELAVVAAAHRWGEAPDIAWSHVGPGWAAAAVAWHAAISAGAAPAALLTEAASRMREAEARRLDAAAHRAGVLLVLPLGLCFLPGFVGTTVAPVVLRLVGAMGS
ncbi:MAG: type II secretion system F family protein [Dermatophilaceae bacterium]